MQAQRHYLAQPSVLSTVILPGATRGKLAFAVESICKLIAVNDTVKEVLEAVDVIS